MCGTIGHTLIHLTSELRWIRYAPQTRSDDDNPTVYGLDINMVDPLWPQGVRRPRHDSQRWCSAMYVWNMPFCRVSARENNARRWTR
jgi:hypothetical protein